MIDELVCALADLEQVGLGFAACARAKSEVLDRIQRAATCMRRPAPEEDIQEAGHRLRAPLPAEICDFYRTTDGLLLPCLGGDDGELVGVSDLTWLPDSVDADFAVELLEQWDAPERLHWSLVGHPTADTPFAGDAFARCLVQLSPLVDSTFVALNMAPPPWGAPREVWYVEMSAGFRVLRFRGIPKFLHWMAVRIGEEWESEARAGRMRSAKSDI